MEDFLARAAFVAAKSAGIALVLFAFARLMGKKQLSQLSFFDYVIGITIGSVPAQIIAGLSVADGLISMAVWSAIPIVFSLLSLSGLGFRRLLDGSPTVLVRDGQILERNLRMSRFTINDLLEELRIQEVFDLGCVRYVILETSGRVSVLKNPEPGQQPPGCYYPVIIDGIILKRSVKRLGHDRTWLDSRLAGAGIKSVSEVLLGECDDSGTARFIKRNPNSDIYSEFR